MSNDTATEAQLKAISQANCYPYTRGLVPAYGYYPSEAAGIIFVVLFAIPFFYHTFQSLRLRVSTSILLALGALTELVGWAARLYSSRCSYNGNAFLAQEVTLIIAPVFFSAALYVLLGRLIIGLGRSSSMLSPKMYTIVFCTCDVVSLVVQAVGGAQTSTASSTDQAGKELGTHIMVAGIAFQLFTMTLFGLLLIDFFRRVFSRGSEFRGFVTAPVQRVLVALVISFIMIYIRSIYRTIELAQGWTGYLITHEGYFIGLDASIMVIAVGVFVAVDPALHSTQENAMVVSIKW
ncbi:RTA1-domain-containing protein [Cryphonectria parasitica EP155]|uniref:RTA1-domain-containing protein n=1 Tax=Cryphonectria parasitica (strain ATCC 38755 / EP155) TaxID=660469 RepID=A0A9P4XYV1_CRYP1|nr:RTA1-domain-containing protein [Cryphonectria parasitica EP155]KAF3763300.1 RTA1-domain-containing protein [Cryphonectria parasitica EP155]